jgi:hydroxyacylglutathione hydrolase
MKIIQIPILSDNYSYLIVDEKSNISAIVDPAEPKTIIDTAKKYGVSISCILTTHHHWDHAGGNKEIVSLLGNTLKVYGGDERIDCITNKIKEGDIINIGSINIKVYFTPCHTSGHVLYEIKDSSNLNEPVALFTGDTLFVAGCGKFFEGTAEQMYDALIEKISKMDPKTQIYCGHEYTLKNLEFAKTIEPNNQAIQKKLEWAKKQRSQNLSTIPSTIGEELTYNPFMRVNKESVARALGFHNTFSPIEVMAELRKRKDKF